MSMERGATERDAPRQGVAVMTTMVGTFPHFTSHGVVSPPRVDWSYLDLVDELRRSALRHFEEEQQAERGSRRCCSADKG